MVAFTTCGNTPHADALTLVARKRRGSFPVEGGQPVDALVAFSGANDDLWMALARNLAPVQCGSELVAVIAR